MVTETRTYASINDRFENHKQIDNQSEGPTSIFGVNIKRGVKFINVFGLFYIAAIMTAVSGYINAQMTFLL